MSKPLHVFSRVAERFPVLCLPSDTIAQRYRVVSDKGDAPEDAGDHLVAWCVGVGAYGAVLRVIDPLDITRALKVCLSKRSNAGPRVPVLMSFPEVSVTSAHPFKHVVGIIDLGSDTDTHGGRFSYSVSPFVDGVTLGEFIDKAAEFADPSLADPLSRGTIRTRHRLHDVVLRLIDDILAGLTELQDADVAHMDISPTNIIVVESMRPAGIEPDEVQPYQAYIVDLGAAKLITSDRTGPTEPQRNPKFFPDTLDIWDNTSTNLLYEKLYQFRHGIDLYGLGRTLETLILDRARRESNNGTWSQSTRRSEAAKEHRWRLVLGSDFSHLDGLVNQLISAPSSGATARTIRRAFSRIPARDSSSILDSNLLTDRSAGIRVRAGDALVKAATPADLIIEHPTFQRLRLLHQLSFIDQVFPGATHTRFAHSLDTFELAKRYVLALNRNATFKLVFSRRDVDLVLLAALLHDIGQYHFSHTIEDLKKMGSLARDQVLSQIKYDQELIADFVRRKEDVPPSKGGPHSIADILEAYDYSVDDICYLAQKTPKDVRKRAALNCGRDIISGTVDVDRISYLKTDSWRTGVPFGSGIDVGGLIESLTIRDDSASVEGIRYSLAIEEGGVAMVEAVWSAVYWMYRDVYWRHTNRAFMAVVKFVMKHLLMSGETTFDRYVMDFRDCTDWQALNYLRSAYDQYAGSGERGVFNPLGSLVSLHRVGYRRVFTLAYSANGEDGLLYDRIAGHITPQREDQALAALADALPAGVRPQPGEILLDVPLKRRLRQAGAGTPARETTSDATVNQKLFVCCRSPVTKEVREWVDIADRSVLAQHLGESEDHTGRKIRVFISRTLLDRLAPEVTHALEESVRRLLVAEAARWANEDARETARLHAGHTDRGSEGPR